MADGPFLCACLHRAFGGAGDHDDLHQVFEQTQGTLGMAAVQSKIQRLWDGIAVALVLVLLVIMMIPLYWICSTASKPRADATTVPPTVFFKPEITALIKLLTPWVERRGEPNKEEYAKGAWWEKLVMDGGERIQ